MKNWKKTFVAAAVLLTVCGGIYANWSAGQQALEATDLTKTLNEEKLMNQDVLVMAEGEEVLHNTGEIGDYFAAVRLSRQQARDSAVTVLQEAMAYQNVDGAPEASSEEIEELVETALCESQIESLVIAKGYQDCVAYIGQDGISVAVAAPEGGMKPEDIAVVADVILSQSDYKMEDIRVVEVE